MANLGSFLSFSWTQHQQINRVPGFNACISWNFSCYEETKNYICNCFMRDWNFKYYIQQVFNLSGLLD